MEPNESKHEDGQQMRKLLPGVLIISAGLLLLLSNLGILSSEFKNIIFSWPMLLVGIGLVSFFSSENKTSGTILLIIGGVFLIPRIFDLPFNIWHMFWPLILIGIGVLILTQKMPGRRLRQPGSVINNQDLQDGFIHEENIFSGGKQRVTHQMFKGGHINCIFGGSEVDLTQASLAEGVNELEINTVFGGVTLIVPADWRIQVKMTSIMGGFSDKRAYIKENPDSSRVLVIKGSTIFGGGEIKSY